MGVVDASVLVDLFDQESPRHEKAKSVVKTGALVVTPGVLLETTQVVRRRATERGADGAAVARTVLVALRSAPGYRFVSEADDEAIAALFAADRRLSYTDAWGVWLARHLREELWTFDDAQRAAFRKAI